MIRQALVHLTELLYMFAQAAEEELSVSPSRRYTVGVLTHLVIGFQPFVDIVVNESSPDEPGAAGPDNCEGFMLVAVTPSVCSGLFALTFVELLTKALDTNGNK